MTNTQENSISKFIEAREREFEETYGTFDLNDSAMYQGKLYKAKDFVLAFHTASMKGLVDVLRDVINEIEICTCKPGDACNVCGGNKDKGVKEKMLEALEKKGLENNKE